MVKRRDWWLGVALVVAVLLFHALIPRYEWHVINAPYFARMDRWTGRSEAGYWSTAGWISRAESAAKPKAVGQFSVDDIDPPAKK